MNANGGFTDIRVNGRLLAGLNCYGAPVPLTRSVEKYHIRSAFVACEVYSISEKSILPLSVVPYMVY